MKKILVLLIMLFSFGCINKEKEEKYNFATREVNDIETELMLNELNEYVQVEMKYVLGGQDTPTSYLEKVSRGEEAGIDCSGLIVNLIKVAMNEDFKLNFENKIVYDTTANGLYHYNSKAINKENLRQGDLIFFDTNNSKNTIEHVVIVDRVEGNNIYIWDATTYQGINKVSHRYYDYTSEHFNNIFVNYARLIRAI